MANGKNYYEVLGLNKNATAAEIKSAYRKLARSHHPDMVKDGDKKAAEKRFKEINEAYQVLSDTEKRRMYDQFGHAGPGFGGAQGGSPFGGAAGNWGPFTYSYTSGGRGADFDPFDIFEDFFGFRGFGGRRAPQKGKNLYYELHINFKDSLSGVEKEINVESGKVKIKIPGGVHSGTEIRFANKGMPGPNNLPAGDLFLTVRVILPEQFKRAGQHLFSTLEISMVQAALGDEVEIPVIDLESASGVGKAELKIPQGTQPGTQFRLRGKGLPRLRSQGRGDVIVQVFVTIPKRLSRKQRQILEDYRES
ncbi:DnaJ C-terminal domain-containing protein [Patescibacteria group bacterium]